MDGGKRVPDRRFGLYAYIAYEPGRRDTDLANPKSGGYSILITIW